MNLIIEGSRGGSDLYIISIIIKISDASPSGTNKTFTKLQSNPTSTCATEKKENRC